jgi:hypothetical protein
MVQLSATGCSCIAILWVSIVSSDAITHCVASQRVFIVVSVYFVIDSDRKILVTPSYVCKLFVMELRADDNTWLAAKNSVKRYELYWSLFSCPRDLIWIFTRFNPTDFHFRGTTTPTYFILKFLLFRLNFPSSDTYVTYVHIGMATRTRRVAPLTSRLMCQMHGCTGSLQSIVK